MLDAYWQTLCGGYWNGNTDSGRTEFLRWYKWKILLRRGFRITSFLGSIRQFTLFRLLFLTVLGLIAYSIGIWQHSSVRFEGRIYPTKLRRAIRTREGYIGLVPGNAGSNDLVAIFKGGRLPLLIRRKGSNFTLLGEVYLHGIMKGEAFEEVAFVLVPPSCLGTRSGNFDITIRFLDRQNKLGSNGY
ncbi:hypothetical protein M501DRAFT_1051808 [Patellaria atrata CBS 101060]|uniref:Uncharacterized protein n=1 Tax=Patellaria atrata CBS 101060 TaxID=1346257 RepID=A0A9P4SBD0_9PEZI|nr:hypothetical protein M501DRAFT_1051808 [Patellaria atrata CBS 101060]